MDAAEYSARLIDYRSTMSLALEMLSAGIISEKDYDHIDRIMAKKYGLSLDSIWCRSPLIPFPTRGNMPHTNGGDVNGENDKESTFPGSPARSA